MKSFEELSVSVKITGFINMAIKKEISWKTLSIVVKDLTSTHEKAQNVVNILLQIFKSKFQTDHHEKEFSTIASEEVSIHCEIGQNISEDKALDLENSESDAEHHEFACSICDQAFDNQLAFENHIEIHQKYGGKKENSPAFENEYYYYVGSDSETCEENNDQNSQLITNDSMEKSKDDSHDQEIIEIDKETIKLTPKENFVCKTCGKMFSRRGTLKRHEKNSPWRKTFPL